jgi:ribosome-associated translation inhibitor RaiA
LAAVTDPDPRSIAAIATKRKWINGKATDAELGAAWDAANKKLETMLTDLLNREEGKNG